jgi:lipid-A-disaccharide synthase
MSPTNLVTMTEIVPEFLQAAATPSAITQMSLELLLNPAARSQMLQGYADIRQALGSVGVCDRAAQHIFTLL